MIPTPLYKDDVGRISENAGGMRQNVINEILPNLIPEIARLNGIPSKNVIDLFTEMGGKNLKMKALFPDHVHCNDLGYLKMAEIIYYTLERLIW